MGENVTVEIEDGVAEIVIDAPTEGNLLDEATTAAYSDAVAEVEGSDARAAVVRGAGGPFSSGGDLSQSPEAFVRTIDAAVDGILATYTSDVPYVAAVRGACVGGGMEIALACDLRVVGTDATMALPEARVGIVPPAGAMRFLAQVAGRGRALELLLTGRRIDAGTAEEWGIATRTVVPDEVHDAARDLAADLAGNSVPAMAAMKQSVNEAFPKPIDEARWDLALGRVLAHGEDFAEGSAAFLEGRRPDFRE